MFTKEFIYILEQVSSFQESCTFNEPWFRGHSSDEYKLLAGLFRENHGGILQEHLKRELDYYYSFKNMGYSLHNDSDWTLLYRMQHYGMPTRLLDWTKSFAIALYFARATWDTKKQARIWMLDPYVLNEKSLGQKVLLNTAENPYELVLKGNVGVNGGTHIPNTVALSPYYNNPRIIAQSGVFTIQGNTLLPLDEEYFEGTKLSLGAIMYIDLPPEVMGCVERYLALNSVNHFTVFTDLEGLAMHIRKDLFPI